MVDTAVGVTFTFLGTVGVVVGLTSGTLIPLSPWGFTIAVAGTRISFFQTSLKLRASKAFEISVKTFGLLTGMELKEYPND